MQKLTSSNIPIGRETPFIESDFIRVVIAIISLLGIAIATVSVNITANVVSPANDFANLSPKHISFKTGGLITGTIGILIMPWKLLASADVYIFKWLVGYSALLGPIAGVMIVDYWLLRHQELELLDLYRADGIYSKYQPSALISLILGILPNIPGFIRASYGYSDGNFFDAIYPYSWFIGLFISGGVHWLLATRFKG